jgi:hypothetical protein
MLAVPQADDGAVGPEIAGRDVPAVVVLGPSANDSAVGGLGLRPSIAVAPQGDERRQQSVSQGKEVSPDLSLDPVDPWIHLGRRPHEAHQVIELLPGLEDGWFRGDDPAGPAGCGSIGACDPMCRPQGALLFHTVLPQLVTGSQSEKAGGELHPDHLRSQLCQG